jgi:sigma-B regulation protein RsbU (phosphoserine phosphatase)
MPLARILVVDDEPDMKDLIKQKFRQKIRANEYEFHFAENGFEALEKISKDGTIDLILTDINMPQLDGLTLLKKIRELNNPVLRAVVISAYGDMENIRTAMNNGAFDFVTKPIDFEDLEITIQKTLHEILSIKQALEVRDNYAAVKQELDIARNIQLSILPKTNASSMKIKGVDIAAMLIPAHEVGGDFYDFFKIDEHRLGFCIGDVSGKGIPAAIFMAVCKTALKSIAVKGTPADECFRSINTTLLDESPLNVFVTVFYGILNIQTGELEYCNAGHNPTYHITSGGQVNPLPQVDGIPFGFKDYPYGKQTITLQKGDTLFLSTDGIDEAMDKDENEFSGKRLMKTLEEFSNYQLSDLNKSVIGKVQEFTGGISQSDDITMLALRYLP